MTNIQQSRSCLSSTLRVLSLFATFFALGVIALGAFTRLMDAGLGCPDWPLCYGHAIVPSAIAIDKYKAWAEMIHRYFAGMLSVLILFVIVLSFFRPNRNRTNIICAIGLIFLISYQIILGQLTVTLKLMPIIVLGHLLGGFCILSLLWLVFLNATQKLPKITVSKGIIFLGYIALILLFSQIMLGAWTSTNYAALSCPDFPFCFNDHPFFTMDFQNAFHLLVDKQMNYEGGVLPDTARQTIHMMHRIGALIITVYLFIFTLILRLKSPVIIWIWGLLTLQIFLGILNVILSLPLFSAVSHTLVASMLLLSLVTLLFQLQKRGG